MINNLTPEEKKDWDGRMKKSISRQKRVATYKLIREIVYLLGVIVFATAVIRACNEITWKPKPSDFVRYSLYVDSVINGQSGFEDADTIQYIHGDAPCCGVRNGSHGWAEKMDSFFRKKAKRSRKQVDSIFLHDIDQSFGPAFSEGLLHIHTGPRDTPSMDRVLYEGYERILYNEKEIARKAPDSTHWEILDSSAWLRAHIFYQNIFLKKWEDSL